MDEEIIEIMRKAQCDRIHAERLAEYRHRKSISLSEVTLMTATLVIVISVIALWAGQSIELVSMWIIPALCVIGVITGWTS